MAGHSKWANIQYRKGAQDKKRAKLFTKFGKELTIAAKEGGGDPNFNPRLRLAIEKAKAVPTGPYPSYLISMKSTPSNSPVPFLIALSNISLGMFPAFIVDVVTDNKNRSASELRMTFTRKGGNLGTDGAVAWMFKKQGVITVKSEGIDADEFMMAALEAGAEDVSEEDGVFEVITDYTEFQTVLENLKAAGYNYEEAEIAMNPENKVQITDLDTAKKVMALYEALDDLDDVQEVYANFDIADDILAQLD